MLADMQMIIPSQPTTILDFSHHYLRQSPSSSSSDHIFSDPDSKFLSPLRSDLNCSVMTEGLLIQTTSAHKFLPQIRSGSSCDMGCRPTMEDEHICIDDLSARLGDSFKCALPGSFYAVFDGHRGPEAATFIKYNAMRLFIEDSCMPQTADVDAVVVEELKDSHRKAFLSADLALANDCFASLSSGTTAITALVVGRCLLVANAGDCRAVLSRKGVAVAMSNDHKTSYLPERQLIEDLGAFVDDGYLNGLLSVTRALGDWDMKIPRGTFSALIAEPDVKQVTLTEDDEFLIIASDGVWDVMSSQQAVSLVRRGLMSHNNPQQCAKEVVTEAIRLHTSDNLTVIVICFSSQICSNSEPQETTRRRRCFSLSEEARERLKRYFEGK